MVNDLRGGVATRGARFHPWLREHGDILGDLLGMDLELDNAEHPDGGFSLDLLGRDSNGNAGRRRVPTTVRLPIRCQQATST